MTQAVSLQLVDYLVTAVVLAIPMAIGIGFAIKDAKNMTRLEYLFGGQQMSLFPVTMSLFVTFQSAISLIGMPTEVYLYGTGVFYAYIGLIICFITLYFIFVPLIYPLEVTSIYEYLHMRFQSQAVRMFGTIIGCTQSLFYLAIALLTPALVLQSAGGMPMWMSVLLVGCIGTVYTVIGGIKSVIWTDVFQTIIVFVGIFAIIIKGSFVVGGIDKAWAISNDGGRIKFLEFSPDPRVRQTVWGATLGSIFLWMGTAYNQATLQRIRALRTERDARLTYLVGIPLHFVYGVVLIMVGVVTYAYFKHIQCDPIKAGLVSNANQIVPYFVLTAMADMPGMAGLYMATLFCGSLSTLSSGINALAANTVEDILERPLRNVSERTATICTKVAAAFHGILICGIAYGTQYLRGPVVQMTYSVFAAFGAPVVGMFLLGGLVPWANKYGAIAGGASSFVFSLWITIGSQLYGRKPTKLPPAPVDNCSSSNFTNTIVYESNSENNFTTTDNYNLVSNRPLQQTSTSKDYGFFLYDVSYEWVIVYGIVVCFVMGVAVSLLTRKKARKESHSSNTRQLLFPFCRQFIPQDKHEESNTFDLPNTPCLNVAL